jgi:hypothetical protein
MTSIVWFRRIALAALITLVFGPVAAGQTGIGINFTATGGPNPGAALMSTEAAGFVPLTNWNNVDASNITTTNLINNSGTTTGVQVAVSGSTNSWSIPNGNLGAAAGTPNGKMMQGYLDSGNGPPATTTTVTIMGLNAAGFTGTYHVYVYAVGDANSGRAADYTINNTQTFHLVDDTQFTGTFRPVATGVGGSGNYMDFTVNGADMITLTAVGTTTTDGNMRAPINGIQIVVPEPGAILCAAALGLGGIAALRRRFGRPPP